MAQGVRSFLLYRSARPKKGLARRPQSKAPHALAWLIIELEKSVPMDSRSERQVDRPCEKWRTSRLDHSKQLRYHCNQNSN